MASGGRADVLGPVLGAAMRPVAVGSGVVVARRLSFRNLAPVWSEPLRSGDISGVAVFRAAVAALAGYAPARRATKVDPMVCHGADGADFTPQQHLFDQFPCCDQ